MNIIQRTLTTEKYELSKPIMVGEAEVSELSLPFSELRGRDIVSAQEEFEVLNGGPVDFLENSKNFQAYLISKMSKIPYDIIMDGIPVHDFNALTLAVYRFLLHGV